MSSINEDGGGDDDDDDDDDDLPNQTPKQRHSNLICKFALHPITPTSILLEETL